MSPLTMSAATITETESFVAALRAQSRRYHDQHPFHRKMNEGKLSPWQIRGWVANRFYYQENIPRHDANPPKSPQPAPPPAAGSSASSTTTAPTMTALGVAKAASRRGCASPR